MQSIYNEGGTTKNLNPNRFGNIQIARQGSSAEQHGRHHELTRYKAKDACGKEKSGNNVFKQTV